MEVVSNKLALGITAQSPQGSQRALERKDTASSPQRRWNSSTNRSSHGRRESLAGNSLLSLKAYYRKLRTFKGTVKALINLRRVPTILAGNGSIASVAVAVVETSETTNAEQGKDEVSTVTGPKVSESVRKLSKDNHVLQTVQTQVKDLVEKGHVVAELDPSAKDGVAYRMQGNLEHYTEENLRKRLELQEHPHLVALTQRLWLAAVHEQEEHLTYGEYEAYMIRLHRLILPEFDIAQSKKLIRDDWTRDTEGGEFLDYRYFHFSMFELVDLWTDTVKAEDYISLLYVIMHCLTFEWNDRHLLRDLEDINPIDIMEESKMVSIEEIEKDLAREVNSDLAQMYRDRIAWDEGVMTQEAPVDVVKDEPTHDLPATVTVEDTNTEPIERSVSGAHTERRTSKKEATPRKPSGTLDKQITRTKSTLSNPKERKPSKEISSYSTARGAQGSSQVTPDSRSFTTSVSAQLSSASNGVESARRDHEAINQSDHSSNGASALPNDKSAGQKDHQSSKLNIQERQQLHSSRGSTSQSGPRVIYPSASMNQYGIGGDDSAPPISITSVGSSGDFINMVSKASFIRKPSAMSGTAGLRSSFVHENQLNADGDGIQGYGLQGSNNSVASAVSPRQVQGPEGYIGSHADGSLSPSPRSQPLSPRSPRPPHLSVKEAEVRPGALFLSGEQRSPPIVYGGHSSFSPRVKSAKSEPHREQSQAVYSGALKAPGEAALGASMPPLSALGLDVSSISGNGHIDNRVISRLSMSSPYRMVVANQAVALSDFLLARGYHDSSPRLSRPLPRASRLQQHQTSQMLVENLAMSTLGVQAAAISAIPHSPRTRATTPHAAGLNRHTFAVGAHALSFEVRPTAKPSSPRNSVGKISRWQSSTGRLPVNDEKLHADFGLAGSSARLSTHSPPMSPRKAASP